MTLSVRNTVSPTEARSLDTSGLRENFLVSDLFAVGEIRMTYSHYDRVILGGAIPDGATLKLESSKQVGTDTFLGRRELGIFNIGGPGRVKADGESYDLQALDCLYLPMGTEDVSFESAGGNEPACFYLISSPAHRRTEPRLIGVDDANRLDLGSDAEANKRVLRQYIHPDICETCQLVAGITTIETGSVWNTMPCHTHDRRSEVYLYFNMAPDARVFHFMGEPDETRHVVIANGQAILSPSWSIHCGAATGAYAFIWSMAGDNQDFTDMDMIAMEDLR